MKIDELFEAKKGPDWKVSFKFLSSDKKEWSTGSLVVRDYVTKERAKEAASKILFKKYNGQSIVIVRVTELKPADMKA